MAVGLLESPIYRGIPLFNHFFGPLASQWPQKGGTLVSLRSTTSLFFSSGALLPVFLFSFFFDERQRST